MLYINYPTMYDNLLQDSLDLIKETVSGEREDELKHASKYNYLYTTNAMTMNMVRQTAAPQPDLSKYSPDELVKYITPLVNRALAESKAGINLEHLLQEFILSGVLVGLGKKPMDAIDEVEKWEKTGESKILEASKKNRF